MKREPTEYLNSPLAEAAVWLSCSFSSVELAFLSLPWCGGGWGRQYCFTGNKEGAEEGSDLGTLSSRRCFLAHTVLPLGEITSLGSDWLPRKPWPY